MKRLYSHAQLQKTIERLGQEISEHYQGQEVLAVGVLKGCTIFMSHLLMHIKGDVKIDFMTVSSYKHGTKSGDLKLVQDLDTNVKDRKILIIEDIIDTGKTLAFTQDYLQQRGASEVKTVTLVDKKQRRGDFVFQPADFVGFYYDEAPFIIGFGFDYGEKYRNLPDIYQMEDGDFE